MNWFDKKLNSRGLTRGFTLVEMLVVVAIAGIIMSIIFIRVQVAKSRSRDAVRLEEIKQLGSALGLYQHSRNSFPNCPAESVINGSSDCLSLALIAEGAMSVTPIDPLGGGAGGNCADDGDGDFQYCYVSADGTGYTLRYRLENDAFGLSAGWQAITVSN